MSKGQPLTRVNLLDVRYRQPHLVSIQSHLPSLQRIALKVHRLELLEWTQFFLNLLKTRQFTVACPKLLEFRQVLEPGEVFDGIRRNVNDLQVRVIF